MVPMNINVDMAQLLKIADRREHLCRNPPKCPVTTCCTDQVQITDWFSIPAEWKCRRCKHKFTYEPAAPGIQDEKN
jgi:hypothetical protein